MHACSMTTLQLVVEDCQHQQRYMRGISRCFSTTIPFVITTKTQQPPSILESWILESWHGIGEASHSRASTKMGNNAISRTHGFPPSREWPRRGSLVTPLQGVTFSLALFAISIIADLCPALTQQVPENHAHPFRIVTAITYRDQRRTIFMKHQYFNEIQPCLLFAVSKAGQVLFPQIQLVIKITVFACSIFKTCGACRQVCPVRFLWNPEEIFPPQISWLSR